MTIQTPPPGPPSVPPDEPSRSDQPAIFVSKADAFLAWFKDLRAALASFVSWWPTFKGELDATIAQMNTGAGIALIYEFDAATADADPGPGMLRLSNATQNLSTVARMDATDANGVAAAAVIDLFDDSNSVSKGLLKLQNVNDPTRYMILGVTAVAPLAGYRNITAAVLASSSANPFAAGDMLLVSFVPSGDIATGTVSSFDIQNQAYVAYLAGGTPTAFAFNPAPALGAYANGQRFYVTFPSPPGLNPTINISGLGPLQLLKQRSDGVVPIAPNEWATGHRSRVTVIGVAGSVPTSAIVETVPAPRPLSNRMINGGCRVSQYGPVGLTNAGGISYGGCDRFYSALTATTVACTIAQAAPDVAGIGRFGFVQRLGVTSTTGPTAFSFHQRIEAINVADLGGRWTVGSAMLYQDTGVMVPVTASLVRPATKDNWSGALTTLGSVVVNVPSGAPTKCEVALLLGAADAANGLELQLFASGLPALNGRHIDTADWFLDEGVTTPAGCLEPTSYQQELDKCRRYFRLTPPVAAGIAYSVNSAAFVHHLSPPMRVAPTITGRVTTSSFLQTANAPAAGNWSGTSASSDGFIASFVRTSGSWPTAGMPIMLQDTVPPMSLSAEL